MLEYILTFLKGLLFGASNLIPGMSGGTMLVITNIYEKLLDSIANVIKKFKSVITFLLVFGIGAVIGVLAGAKVINLALRYAAFPTATFFAGIILGSIPFLAKPVIKKINLKYVFAFILGALVVIGLMLVSYFLKNDTQTDISKLELGFKDYILLFLSGFIGCILMLIPGVSGVLMLVVFNYYSTFMNALDNLTHFSIENYHNVILVILPVGLGILCGLIPASKLLSYLFKKFPVGSYFAILGFVIASIAVIFVNVNYGGEGVINTLQVVLACITLPIGFVISFMLSLYKLKMDKKKEETEETKEIENLNEEEVIE